MTAEGLKKYSIKSEKILIHAFLTVIVFGIIQIKVLISQPASTAYAVPNRPPNLFMAKF